MKKITLLVLLICFLSKLSFAQPPNKREVEEKIETQRIAFITTRLDLSTAEAQTFWPVYNKYKKEDKALKKSIVKPNKLKTATDAEIEQYLKKTLEVEAQQLALKKEYFNDLKTVLPVRKIPQLFIAERAFTQMVVRKMNNRAGNRRQRN